MDAGHHDSAATDERTDGRKTEVDHRDDASHFKAIQTRRDILHFKARMSSFVTKYYAFYNCISVYLMHNVHSKICTCDSMTLWVIIQIQKDMRKVLAML